MADVTVLCFILVYTMFLSADGAYSPDCQDVNKIVQNWERTSNVHQSTAITDCREECRTLQDATSLAGVRRILHIPGYSNDVECHCGDKDVTAVSGCEHVCEVNQPCGGNSSVTVERVCPAGTYNRDCSAQCPGLCASAVCDIDSGQCNNGCEEGWYGSHCTDTCPNCANNRCDKSGVCEGGCDPGYYTPQCTSQCPQNCLQNTCHINNGTCDLGCNDGWYGENCDLSCPVNCDGGCDRTSGDCLECRAGHYGNRCHKACPANCYQALCDITSGDCSQGCSGAFFGPKCDFPCSDTCNGTLCDPVNGTCQNRCLPGYFGSTCSSQCPVNCLEAVCEFQTGHCVGCQDGFYGSHSCKLRCPQNCAGDVCEQLDGICSLGCETGWTDSRCDVDVDECSQEWMNVCTSEIVPFNMTCHNKQGSYVCCDTEFDNSTQTCVKEQVSQCTCRAPVWVWPILALAILAVGLLVVFLSLRLRRDCDNDRPKCKPALSPTPAIGNIYT